MHRIDLQVPFAEKEEAKRFGARWDPQKKTWYAPAGTDAALLQKWLPAGKVPNIRSPRYFVAATTRDCWHCLVDTQVIAIVLPAGHEVFYAADDPADDCWQLVEQPTIISYVRSMNEPVVAQLRRRAPTYGLDFSQTVQRGYWMNHCGYCLAKLGDFYTFERGVGFNPVSSEQAAEISLQEIVEPFVGWCGSYTCGLEWFADARCATSSPV